MSDFSSSFFVLKNILSCEYIWRVLYPFKVRLHPAVFLKKLYTLNIWPSYCVRFIFGLLPQIQTASYSDIHTYLVLLDLICHSFVALVKMLSLFLGAQISFIPNICTASLDISLFSPAILL
jgi:hypothetical protein